MAKGVLGNDPFRQGAAVRTAEAPRKEQEAAPKPARKRPAAQEPPAQKAAQKKAKRPAARRKPAAARPEEPAPERAAEAGPERLPREAPRAPEASGLPEPAQAEPRATAEAAPELPSLPEEEVASGERERPPEAQGIPVLEPVLEKAAGALTLAKNVAAQTLRTEALSKLARVADGVFSAVMTAVGASSSLEVDTFGKDEQLSRKLAPITDFLYERYWRVSVEGAELVPQGGSLLVANHSGAIPVDGLMLHEALRRERPELKEARWLTEDQVFYAPFLGTLFNRLGAIRASPENAVRLLEEGHPVITFPEGVHGIRKPFQERYQLKRLGRGGFAKLAIRQKVPILPVAIVGAEEAMPLFARLPGQLLGLPYLPITVPPLPAHWYIRFGEPISVESLAPDTADDLLSVQRVVERTRQAIEGMLAALLKERPSVFGA